MRPSCKKSIFHARRQTQDRPIVKIFFLFIFGPVYVTPILPIYMILMFMILMFMILMFMILGGISIIIIIFRPITTRVQVYLNLPNL